ncbi:hypothetical protein BDV95DRAFT_612813 [Massariosphaeria phaeospora]|uniref:Zinc-binding loop region of homing endonuclease domain-containing protein n=1 Tax=Massariosphaeria phaeospora TaxID=100035 RepID=A0A7C8HYM1_9PLEO|nr:hypothetical protein BDV95DRAFT_612813 [Massariosphaeria phaeospora]
MWIWNNNDPIPPLSAANPAASGAVLGHCLPRITGTSGSNKSGHRASYTWAFDCTSDRCRMGTTHAEKVNLTWVTLLGCGEITDFNDWEALIHGGMRKSAKNEDREVSHLCGRKHCQESSHLQLESHTVNNSRTACHQNDHCSGHTPPCVVGSARKPYDDPREIWDAAFTEDFSALHLCPMGGGCVHFIDDPYDDMTFNQLAAAISEHIHDKHLAFYY